MQFIRHRTAEDVELVSVEIRSRQVQHFRCLNIGECPEHLPEFQRLRGGITKLSGSAVVLQIARQGK